MLFRGRQGYSGHRPDILKVIPDGITSIIDFGCGAGGVAAGVKSISPAVRCVGVELDPVLAAEAKLYADSILELDLNTVKLENVDLSLIHI